jgi:general transcription factor 3C polypeptide 3 (transcription factor C subunit 4)
MQEVIRIEPRASAAWSVLAQCYEDMNESPKALQLRIMAAHLRHDAEEWDRLARESKYEPFGNQNVVCSAKIHFIGNVATTSKRYIVIERFTVWIH